MNGEFDGKVMSEAMVKRYIKKLRLGSSPGIDGIISEHLKYAINSGIVRHLSVMLSFCLKHSIMPSAGITMGPMGHVPGAPGPRGPQCRHTFL